MRQLLETSTATWADLFSNGKRYAVPPYQRDYAWEEDQWSDLWRDILALRESNQAHYMGTIVLKVKEDRSFEIIDGQQRLATLSVLALAVIDAIEDLAERGTDAAENKERARLLRDRLVSSKHPASLREESRLRLNENDDGFYQTYLVQLREPQNPKRLKSSEARLWKAFEYFRGNLREHFKDETSGEALARFLTDSIAAAVQFIQITVQTELSAYTVFETLNARGLQLTATDLLKNYLFSLVAASRSDLDQAREMWRRLINIVPMEDFPDFLYHYLFSLGRDASKQRLFLDVRNLVQSPVQVFELMTRLEGAAGWYIALSDPNDELWNEYSDALPYVRELVAFRVDQYKPLILAARDLIGQRKLDARSLLRMCSVISLRSTIIMRRNTADVLRAYKAATEEVVGGRASSVQQIFGQMRSLYPSDEEFESAFSQASFSTGGPRKRVVKYLLTKLEASYGSVEPDFESDPASIEHILPENPADEWTSAFKDEDHARFVYRLGNLTLLEPPLNREAGSKSFAVKKEIYARSKYLSTRAINAPGWEPAAVRSRQADLAKRATKVFRLDY